jgi:hypothetical protein
MGSSGRGACDIADKLVTPGNGGAVFIVVAEEHRKLDEGAVSTAFGGCCEILGTKRSCERDWLNDSCFGNEATQTKIESTP